MGYVEKHLVQGFTLSSHERRVNLYIELGTAKAHGNVELHTLARAHLTIMGSPLSLIHI